MSVVGRRQQAHPRAKCISRFILAETLAIAMPLTHYGIMGFARVAVLRFLRVSRAVTAAGNHYIHTNRITNHELQVGSPALAYFFVLIFVE